MQKTRFKAFLSYSHRDQAWAAWLQRALESYRVPRRLVGTEGEFGSIPRRLSPVFRDREDLSSASDLSAKVKESLRASETLVVVCSPAAAQSAWVSEEIRYFRSLGRANRIYALIVDGDPQAGDAAEQCFPEALITGDDDQPVEPLAADARKWGDGKLLAKLKLVAGILGIPLDALRRRELQRRQRMWMASMAGAVTITVVMTVLAITAITARQAAENRREHAESLVGYMVGDLKTKLDDAGRLDILEGMGGRVSEYLQSLDPNEVTDESLNQQAQVWRQLGEVSMKQGELSEALQAFSTSRDVLAELYRRNPDDPEYIFELGNAEFWVGYVYFEQGSFDLAEDAFNKYLDFADRLVEIEPGNPDWLLEKSYAHNNLAALMVQRGGVEIERALPEMQAAVVLLRQVMELDPDNLAYRSEFGETLAWLADTQLLACNLGEALKARQESTDIAAGLLQKDPSNANKRSRYAYALRGLGAVHTRVGMVEQAIESYQAAKAQLGQLSVNDPTNLVYRYDYLQIDSEIARLLAERGQAAQALPVLAGVRQPMLDLLEEESWENLFRYIYFVGYLLDWSDVLWDDGDAEQANIRLQEARGHLEKLMEAGSDHEAFIGKLRLARFLQWQQHGDYLLESSPFNRLEAADEENVLSCRAQADGVRQAILSGARDQAAALSANLLARGYYEPAFIRVCRQYGVCQQEQ